MLSDSLSVLSEVASDRRGADRDVLLCVNVLLQCGKDDSLSLVVDMFQGHAILLDGGHADLVRLMPDEEESMAILGDRCQTELIILERSILQVQAVVPDGIHPNLLDVCVLPHILDLMRED